MKSVCCDREQAEYLQVIQIRRLSSIENFVSERDDFTFNSFRNFKPVKRFQNRVMCWNFGAWTTVRARAFWMCWRQRVTVVELGVYDGGGNCFGGVKVEVGTDTAKSTDVMVAGFRQSRDLIRE